MPTAAQITRTAVVRVRAPQTTRAANDPFYDDEGLAELNAGLREWAAGVAAAEQRRHSERMRLQRDEVAS